MRILISLATSSALALALAACGGSADGTDETPAEDVAAADEGTGMSADEAAPADGAVDEAADSEAAVETEEAAPAPVATPTPTPTATPAPTPTATTAAAVAPPMFAICSACHSVKPGENGIGPSLAGVFGAKAGHSSGFDYSDAMLNSGLTWNQANLDRYLENPKAVVPGGSMSYNGLKNADQRKAVVDYLKTL